MMVLSHNNFKEYIAPAIMGAKLGVGSASTGQYRECLEEMELRASALKGIVPGLSIFPKGS